MSRLDPHRLRTALAVLLIAGLLGGAAPALAADAPSTTMSSEVPVARTLEEIVIEGEIDSPRILFINSRPPARYRDGMGRHFLPTALILARRVGQPRPLGLSSSPMPVEKDNEISTNQPRRDR